MVEEAVEERRKPGRPPAGLSKFTVEFGTDKNNGFIILRSLDSLQVRGRWLKHNVPGRLPSSMGSMPDVPGAYLTVDARNNKGVVFDPWEKRPEMWKAFNDSRNDQSQIFPSSGKYGPIARIDLVLPPDKLKTLLMELSRMMDGGMCTVVEGGFPSASEIANLVGKQLHDPSSSFRKPKYQEDVEEWYDKLDQTSSV